MIKISKSVREKYYQGKRAKSLKFYDEEILLIVVQSLQGLVMLEETEEFISVDVIPNFLFKVMRPYPGSMSHRLKILNDNLCWSASHPESYTRTRESVEWKIAKRKSSVFCYRRAPMK